MKTNIIVLTKEKLISLDAILPLILELKSRYKFCNFIFIFPNIENLEMVNKNYHIREALQELNAELYAPRRDSKVFITLWMLRFAFKLSRTRNIIIKAGDTLFKHKIYISFLKKISSIIEIKYLIMPTLPDYHTAVKIHWQLTNAMIETNDESGSEPKYIDKADYCLTSLPTELFNEFNLSSYPSEKIFNSGYTRRMEQWNIFLKEMAKQAKIAASSPYYLFILSTFGIRLNSLEEPPLGELLQESLTVLKEFNDRITTVFRPHPCTDVDLLESMLLDIGFKNYKIDYGHPMILAKNAAFVIGNFYSTTMFDAYYMGVPVIEYCYYDRELLRLMGKKSYGGLCCDVFIDRDRKQLEEVVSDILSGKLKIKRDPQFIAENFPETPEATFQLFDRLLTE